MYSFALTAVFYFRFAISLPSYVFVSVLTVSVYCCENIRAQDRVHLHEISCLLREVMIYLSQFAKLVTYLRII
ncbi:unnamed protein product [Schistosoma rodhaini]|uniref:Uncharacterized protein n=1 Tax=Schistosoma rodhaini TaxID=6188 RepID=A0AA85G159_9TREM|nr:unnamed protein product [Schistosoma rodhaini]